MLPDMLRVALLIKARHNYAIDDSTPAGHLQSQEQAVPYFAFRGDGGW
jgi:hypothetical protein